jgi:dTDP-glucose 4,6-dehydratase
MRTWLVTGGAGFIGSNFIRQVLAKNCLTDDPERQIRIICLDAFTYAGNLSTCIYLCW